MAQNVVFGILAAVMVLAGWKVVTTQNVVRAVLYLVVVLAGAAAQFILLSAEFIALVQVLVYIGAIVILFLFGTMLTRAPIGRDVKHRQRMVVVAGGREAITEFVRLGVAGGHSLLQVSLTTGRTHQIRVHLAFIKHPVLGDPVYGHQSPLIGRPALHAETLTLRHPRTGKSMTWQAAPPEDFELAWNSLSVRTMR